MKIIQRATEYVMIPDEEDLQNSTIYQSPPVDKKDVQTKFLRLICTYGDGERQLEMIELAMNTATDKELPELTRNYQIILKQQDDLFNYIEQSLLKSFLVIKDLK